MKRLIAGFVAGIVVAFALPGFAANPPATEPAPVEEEKPITLVVNGQTITLPDAQPRVVDGQVMVPVIPFSEVAGFSVQWDEKNSALLVTTATAKTTQTTQTTVQQDTKKPPTTIEVDGVTYYELNSLWDFFATVFPKTRIGMGTNQLVIGSEYFRVVDQRAHGTAYKDLRPLIRAGLLTQEQIDTYYGR